MDFFVRYYVELKLPRDAVETALDELPEESLALMADKAYARALGIMVEADSALANELVGAESSSRLSYRSGSIPRPPARWPGHLLAVA